MTETMNIWDAVSKTDPAHTKKVNQRGGFTAIDASYQVMNATSQFGPVGIGWGYKSEAPIFEGGAVIVAVTLWHGDEANTFGPEFGCEIMFSKDKNGNDRTDTDAPKKATTDALTKLLSRLGFNADVFLGKFDDSKYVQERTREVAKENTPEPTPRERSERMNKALKACETAEALHNQWGAKGFAAAFKELDKHLQDQLQATYDGMVEDFG